VTAPRVSFAGALVLVVLAGQVVATVHAGLRSPIFGLTLLLVDALGVAYSLRATRHSRNVTAWRLIAAGRALSLTCTTTFAAASVTGGRSWWWAGALTGIAMFVSLSAAVLSIPAQRLRGRQAWAFFAEILTVLVAGFMIIWYFVLHPLVQGPVRYQWVYELGFPIGNLLLLAAVSAVLLRGTMVRFNTPSTLLLTGMLLYVVGDTVFSTLGVRGALASHSAPASLCLTVAQLMMTVAAIKQCDLVTSNPPARPRRDGSTWPSHLPYVGVALSNALMLYVTIRENQIFLWGGLVLGQIVITGSLSLRQFISLRDSRDLAVADPLTGLANRTGLDARLERMLRRDRDIAVLLIDLDDFKLINDAYGHAAGDTVLTEFSRLMRSCVRSTDIAARIGGDEFIIVLADVGTDNAITAAQRILTTTAANPIRLGDDTVPIRASVGISTGSPADGPKEILRRADVAMYQSKRAGNHSWQLYDPSMVDRRARDAALADHLTVALESGQLQVVYQPLVDLADTRMTAVEALIRWQHPGLGAVSPMEFIPIAERTGLITTIGLWVLEQACRRVRTWQQQVPGAQAFYVSVNLSPRQLQEPSIVTDILTVLDRTGLPPASLVLEITESAVVDDRVAIPAMRALREHGIRIAIDDFGTGYSSLHYLTRLPVDILKIDRSFVGELNGTPAGAAVTEAVIRLSQVLRLTTVAEGIETTEQAAELQLLGCNVGQGYLFAKPQPPEAIEEAIRESLRLDV
jgi:diguanylate cyclase (GGDEF)-like protein